MTRRRPVEDTRELAHDLNNLLTAIIGAADAVLERSGIDPETRADVAHIREGARRGAILVRRLRGDPRDPVAPPAPVSVNETIRATERLLDHRLGPNVTLDLRLAEPDCQVMVEPAQLDRALLNLVANARDAMPIGGKVILATTHRVVEAMEARIPDRIPVGEYLVITVTDTGQGIPHDHLSRIFDAGFSSRLDAGGSGLGLASVRDIVHRANGLLSVASVEGQGTRFDIYLPLLDRGRPSIAPDPTATRHVLLVDDDLLVRRVAERSLARAGWMVLCANSGEDALEILKQTRCDLMISDIAMPGMDGVMLARLALTRDPDLPIILTSGYERTATRHGDEITSVAFLAKPYDQAELLETVARITR